MSTFFKYLGHAGFWIRTDKSDFLMDPWFSPNGAYYSGWYQWPPNQKLLANIIQEISYSDKNLFIYLSHEHEDHFCEYTLENITKNKKATFIIPDFEDKNFENTIRKKFNNYNKLLVISLIFISDITENLSIIYLSKTDIISFSYVLLIILPNNILS